MPRSKKLTRSPEDTVTITRSRRVGEAAERSSGLEFGHACLVCIYGEEIGKRWLLAETVVIGRSSSSDITLDQDAVSRSHAKIQRRALVFLLSDLGSTNGTFVGDRPVVEHILEDGDRVRIGRNIFKFLSGANVEANYHEEIYRLMTIDGLTQTYNRRYFDEALEREVGRTANDGGPLSLVLLDIDHFKRTNDTQGHVVGDAVLRQLAAAITPLVAPPAVFARTGGEEFGVLLPDVARADALKLAEKVRRAVAATKFGVDLLFSSTISAGVAEWGGGESPERLYERADQALYAAKEAGRNRVAG